jgi:hypothetical protein
MPDQGRSNLKINVDPFSAPFFSTDDAHDSFTANRPYKRSANAVIEEMDLTSTRTLPVTWATASQTFTFEIERKAERWFKKTVVFDLGAVTGATRLSDWEAFAMIDYVQYRYNNRVLFKITGDKMFMECMRDMSRRQRSTAAKLQGGFLSAPARVSRLAERRVVELELRDWWNDAPVDSLAASGLPNKLYLDVVLKDISKVHKSATSCTINDCYLRSYWVHRTQAKRMQDFTISRTTGFTAKVWDYNYHPKETLVAADMSALVKKIKLPNLKQDTYRLSFMLRNANDENGGSVGSIVPTWNNVIGTFNLLKLPSSYYLTEGGQQITETYYTGGVPSKNAYKINDSGIRKGDYNAPEGVQGVPIGEIVFALPGTVQASRRSCNGSRRLSNYGNLELVLNWEQSPDGVAIGSQNNGYGYDGTNGVIVDIYADTHQLVYNVNGDLKKFVE